jgi:short-subunit dehydrogenase
MKNIYTGKHIIITGASMGLGKSLAERFAKDGCPLILLSLPGEGLLYYSNRLENKYGVRVRCYETDLSKKRNIEKFYEWVNSLEVEVGGLVNNAGFGGSARFELTCAAHIDNMLMVNVRALTIMTRLFVPNLMLQDKSFILNVSSIAAFKPMPFKTVYPASKAFVYSFSVGLGEELKNSSVRVAVLHPGPMDTSNENGGRISKHGIFGKMACMSVEEVAEIAVNHLLRGKKVIVPGLFNKFCIRLMKLVPRSLAMPMMFRVVRKEIV